MYQWKLLNHVSRDHNMTLKPAHLSYKCTVCTATFGMYKQFENHVYSAHSTVAKKAMDNKKAPGPGSSKSGDSLLKPLKINDEITIIPQPASRHSQKNMDIHESHVIGKLHFISIIKMSMFVSIPRYFFFRLNKIGSCSRACRLYVKVERSKSISIYNFFYVSLTNELFFT